MADSSAVTKAVVPAAGLGIRFLPATKATPKEMLPIVDKPAIQYVVEEAVSAGLDDVLLITGRSKRSIEDHFDRAYELEEALAAKDNSDGLAQVRASAELATVHYVRQGDPRGLGHAVLCAARHVGNEPFAVLLGDDLIDPRDPLLTRMIEVREQFGGSVVALMEVDPEQVSLYGCAAIEPTDEEDVVTITDLVEKPVPGSAPSRWIIIGRYVCDPQIFDILRQTPPGRGGEIQLTDALKVLAKDPASGGVYGVLFRGRRYDTGNKLDYLRTLVMFASERPDLSQEFVPGRASTWTRGRDRPGRPPSTRCVTPKDLTSVDAHLADILDSIRPLPPTHLGITEAEAAYWPRTSLRAARSRLRQLGHGRVRADRRRHRGASKDAPVTCGSAARSRPATRGPTRSPTAAACHHDRRRAARRGGRGGSRRGHRRRDRPGGDPRGGGTRPRGPVQRRGRAAKATCCCPGAPGSAPCRSPCSPPPATPGPRSTPGPGSWCSRPATSSSNQVTPCPRQDLGLQQLHARRSGP